MLTAVPDSITMTGAVVPAHKFTLPRSIGRTGEELPRRLLFQPDTGLPGVGHKSLLDLLMGGGDAIGEAREAEHVVIDGVVNGRVGFEGVWAARACFGSATATVAIARDLRTSRLWLGTCACSSRGPDVLTLKSAKLSV